MRTIYKYKLPMPGEITAIEIPEESTVHHFGYLQGRFWLWVEVNTDTPEGEPSRVVVLGTGHPIPDDFEYYGTCFTEGDFVWHLFVEMK